MKVKLILLIALMAIYCTAFAQTKVFKEVGKDITSYSRAIVQDDQVVGYLRFTKLEKKSADSFNYEINIMDENLNDLGTVKFSEEQMLLQGVAFEKDVLCLAYLKSNVIGTMYKTRLDYKRSLDEAKNAVTLQFLTLSGKIINTVSTDVSIPLRKDAFNSKYYGQYKIYAPNVVGYGNLEHPIQLSNLPGKGFVSFYGDDKNNYLTAYSTDGKELWRKEKPGKAQGFALHTSGDKTYLLRKTENRAVYGGNDLFSFDSSGTELPAIALLDKAGAQLSCLNIGNDLHTGKMYLTGNIIDPKRCYKHASTKLLARGYFQGVYSLKADENDSMKFNFSSWHTGKYPQISKKGYFRSTKDYLYLGQSFKVDNNSVYYVGTSYNKRFSWGTAVVSVITAPFILFPIVFSMRGYNKTMRGDTRIMQQDSVGHLAIVASIMGEKDRHTKANNPYKNQAQRSFYKVTNSDTKKEFIIIYDFKTIKIYNITDNKLVRTIERIFKPRKILAYSTVTDVLPAKEGHILVKEYDEKTNTTRYSIEAL